MRFAFELAGSTAKLLTVVTKSNAQRYGMVLWDESRLQSAAISQTLLGRRCWSTR